MRSRELIGKEVIDANARIIGPVRDVEIDLKRWTVTAVIVRAGFIKKLTVLTGDIDKIGDKVMLKVAVDKIEKA
ncbi:MAG: PRC-barrel domain-containing protein [Candidatus Bathyarchaeia archaeon]|jgi:sporulation protein YlmC with PRC-barrel domain